MLQTIKRNNKPQSNKLNIVQWNINGFSSRKPSIEQLLTTNLVHILGLQDMRLEQGKPPKINGFKTYHKTGPLPHHGGVALLISEHIHSEEIPLRTNIEITAARIIINHTQWTICSIYLPDPHIPARELQEILSKLPKPLLAMGDFNSHHTYWGSPSSDTRGRTMLKIINNTDLFILNDGSPTFLSGAHKSFTHIDLTLVDQQLSHNFSWSTYHDLMDSDHFPIFITSTDDLIPNEKIEKWNLEKANWKKYTKLAAIPSINSNTTVEEDTTLITNNIIAAAEESIPTLNIFLSPQKYKNYWWNDNCEKKIKVRKKTLREFKKNNNETNYGIYMRHKRIARQTVRDAKSNAWMTFVNSINGTITSGPVWKKIAALKGKARTRKITLKNGTSYTTDQQEVSNLLALSYSTTSSTTFYTPDFRNHMKLNSHVPMAFKSPGNQEYNKPLTLHELTTAIYSSKNSSPGPDKINNLFIKNLSATSTMNILSYLNKIWQKEVYPRQWKISHLIPIPKPGKIPTETTSYRPIALTSCLSKTMEKIINSRLLLHLEKHNILNPHQSGFRKSHSTFDGLSRLEHDIKQTFQQKQFLVTIFIDIEKAFDTVWHTGLLTKIHQLGLRGNLPIFIQNFMDNRRIQVKVGASISKEHVVETGLPQGSVLSPTLFLLMINDIITDNNKEVAYSLFADDLAIWTSGPTIQKAVQKIQPTLDLITKWSQTNGLKISQPKSKYMIFTKKNQKAHTPPKLENKELDQTKIYKFLGITLDQKLTWAKQIADIKERSEKPLTILRYLSHTKWGSDEQTLRTLYMAMVRPILDYGSFLFEEAAKTHLKNLDRIQYKASRLITGALINTKIIDLEALAHLKPLNLRRNDLGLKYIARTLNIREHPIQAIAENTPNNEPDNQHKPFINRALETLYKIGINPKTDIPALPKFIKHVNTKAKIDLSLAKFRKEETSPETYRELFLDLKSQYPNYNFIYTDGSLEPTKGTGSAVHYQCSQGWKLPNHSSIFTAEQYALFEAVGLAASWRPTSKFWAICSDSLSALQSLQNPSDKSTLTQIIKQHINQSNLTLVLIWIPSHVGIEGNEKADQAAKLALNLPNAIKLQPSYNENCQKILKHSQQQWQEEWGKTNSQLKRAMPNLSCKKQRLKHRKDAVIINRVRTGTCMFTHGHHFKGEERLQCEHCHVNQTVAHILIDCPIYDQSRIKLERTCTKMDSRLTLNTILNPSFPPSTIIEYLKEIDYYDKI